MQEFDLAKTLDGLKGATVLCIGDVMLDRFVEGTVNRISPEAPIPILSVKGERETLGGAANVARNVSALGATCRLIGVAGLDDSAHRLTALIGDLPGVEADIIVANDRPTAIKTRYIAGLSQILRTDRETIAPLPEDTAKSVEASAARAIEGAGALILSDYGKGVLSDSLIATLISKARDAGIPVIVDPKGKDFSRYRGADLVTPNRAELALASDMPTGDDDAVIAACRKVVSECGIGGVLATRSEQGMTLFRNGDDGRIDHIPTRAREVFDVAGAGDTVVAALATGLAAGLAPPVAAQLANRAAGIVVGKTGTAVAYPGEILSDEDEHGRHQTERKVLKWDEAQDRVAVWRRAGKSVGFTNGCFDLLHPGHIALIGQARGACDRLIVGLNSDASVKRLKGQDRPVQGESARATVLAALEHVDLVVIFDQDTPLELITALQPDVLVKGADYTKDQVVGADIVEARGGRVVLADLVAGQSTTATIAKLSSGA